VQLARDPAGQRSILSDCFRY